LLLHPIAWRVQLKTAAMLAKTKMKLSATGDRGVPEESRFYLRVVMDTPNDAPPNLSSSSSDSSGSGGGPMPSKALFFSGRVSVGKVLDRCAEAFGVDVRPSGNEGEDFSFNRCLQRCCTVQDIFALCAKTVPRLDCDHTCTRRSSGIALSSMKTHALVGHVCGCVELQRAWKCRLHELNATSLRAHAHAAPSAHRNDAVATGMLCMYRAVAPPTLLPNGSALSAVEGLLNGDTVVMSRRTAAELEDDDRLFSWRNTTRISQRWQAVSWQNKMFPPPRV
jgi:hypothetical protein